MCTYRISQTHTEVSLLNLRVHNTGFLERWGEFVVDPLFPQQKTLLRAVK